MDTKTCTKCAEEKPVGSFHKDAKRPDGFQSACKSCRCGHEKQKRNDNPSAKRCFAAEQAALAANGTRRCSTCGEVKRLSVFGRQEGTTEGRCYICKPCASAKSKAWRIKNVDRTWAKRNPERKAVQNAQRHARKLQAPGSYSVEDVVRLWHRQRGECFWCSVRIGKRPEDRAFHVDHVTPLARGGSNYAHNLCLACPSCNLSKSDRFAAAFRHAA